MALAAIIDNLDSVAENIRPEYKPAPGGKGFILDVTPVGTVSLEDVGNLKKALTTERAAAKQASEKLKLFEGIDPEAARGALEKVSELGNLTLDQKVEQQLKIREQQLEQKHKTSVDKLSGELKEATGQLEKNLVTSVATTALAAKKGSVELLLPHVKSQTRMRKIDGVGYVTEILDSQGNPRISPSSGSTALMTIEELVDEMSASDAYSRAFDASGATGSGATTATNGSSAANSAVKNNSRGPVKTVSRKDKLAMSQNLDKIASGEVQVSDE